MKRQAVKGGASRLIVAALLLIAFLPALPTEARRVRPECSPRIQRPTPVEHRMPAATRERLDRAEQPSPHQSFPLPSSPLVAPPTYDYDHPANIVIITIEGPDLTLGDSMHARYYSPNLGRFVSVDPVGGSVGSSQSWNRYSYVLNNPINGTDPTGEFAWFGAAAGAAIDLGFQMIVEKKSIKEVNWVSVGVSAASGATGVGLGRVVTKNVAKSAALRIAANSAGSAVVGGAATTANTVGTNIVEGNDLTEGLSKEKVLTGMATNAVAGGLGSAADEALSAGGKALGKVLDQQDLLDDVPFYAVGNRGESLENLATGVGNAAGTTASNSGVVIKVVRSHDPPRKPVPAQ